MITSAKYSCEQFILFVGVSVGAQLIFYIVATMTWTGHWDHPLESYLYITCSQGHKLANQFACFET